MNVMTYKLLNLAFGVSNAGKIVIVQGAAKYYYTFHTCIVSTINPNNIYSKPHYYKLISLPSIKWTGVALETKCAMKACQCYKCFIHLFHGKSHLTHQTLVTGHLSYKGEH